MKNSPKLAAGAVVAALLLSGCVAPAIRLCHRLRLATPAIR